MTDRRRMSPRREYRRLRLLLDECLQPFSDIAFDSLTEETEKDLLIALSQVLRQVKQWTHEFDSDEEEELVDPVDDIECSVSSTSHLDDRHCLVKIIANLMFLLPVNSIYVQHLTGNILVAISEFLLTLDSGWDDFMHLLCLCLELSICNCLISSSQPGALKTSNLAYEPSTSQSLLKTKLKSANWFVVAAIFRVLHNIQKHLNQDTDLDHKIVKGYLDSVGSMMINLPLDILREVYVGHNTRALNGSAKDVPLRTKTVKLKEILIFFGSFIRFLCSLVPQSSSLDNGVGFERVICRIVDLVPKLTAWCHAELQSPHHVGISHYFRHKVLMLMVKLSSTIPIDQSIHVTWIDLVHKYFEDILLQPLSVFKLDEDDFLEGSPFCTSIYDYRSKQNMLSRHLQRLTVFLYFKCSLSSIDMKGSLNEPQCAYGSLNHNRNVDLKSLDSECRSESIGFRKLHEWLQAHVEADILADDELYYDRCVRFASSFLQLFMHEDDILFEMLLQLFRVPFYPDRQISKNRLVFLASDLFNPIHIFHLFLAEIHYDHQVLLDYLISKDTGSTCAEYLLRSLRIVCNSWSLFVEFRGVEEGLGQLCPKKRQKVLDYNKEHNNGGHGHGRKGNYRLPFVAATDCLVLLETSIDSLNRKKLFPYNPQVLLRRLKKFQELSAFKQ